MEMHWNIWNIKEGYSTYVLGGQITQGTSIHSTIQNNWTVTSNAIKKSQRYRARERWELTVAVPETACMLLSGPLGSLCVWEEGYMLSVLLCHRGLDRVVWSRVRVGRCVLSRNAVLRGSELGRWVRLGHGFWGCWGVLITLKNRKP